MKTKFKYIQFVKKEQKTKTSVWFCRTGDGSHIGVVKWYGPWRQYVFYPGEKTVFNTGCLNDIVEFITSLRREEVLKDVVVRIKKAFPDSEVKYMGRGSPDGGDDECFEAYMIPDDRIEEFEELSWTIHKGLGEPNGISICITELNPETTLKCRQEEYDELRKPAATGA